MDLSTFTAVVRSSGLVALNTIKLWDWWASDFSLPLAPLPWTLAFLSNCLLDFLLGYHIAHWQAPDWAPDLTPSNICSCHTDPHPFSSCAGQEPWRHPWLHFFSHFSHSIHNKSLLPLPLKYIQNLLASTPLRPPAPTTLLPACHIQCGPQNFLPAV